jgi:arginine utilization protein RocB
LTDDSGGEPGTPVSLLSLKDSKRGYDVTTPGSTFLFWNVLLHERQPDTVLPIVANLVREAVRDCVVRLAERAAASPLSAEAQSLALDIPVLTYSALLTEVLAQDPEAADHLQKIARESAGTDLPERCRRMTEALWERSRRSGPAVILGLGSIPYLATQVMDPWLSSVIEAFLLDVPTHLGETVTARKYFAGISDMSFFGQADDRVFAALAAETPIWEEAIGLRAGALAQIPTINIGPWGRDYHTPLERTHVDYTFHKLPLLIADLTRRILAA